MTYLTVCNEVLTSINEVAFNTDGSDFAASRGIQTTVKNAVNAAIRDIYNAETEWPFAYTSGTQLLTVGTAVYALPTSLKSTDWESFFVRPIEEITNGEFTTTITSWTDISAGSGTAAYTSSNSGAARLTGDGTDIGGLTQSLSTVASRNYKVLLQHFSNGVTIKIGTTSGGAEIQTETITLDSAGEGELYDFTFTATGATTFLSMETTSTTAVDVAFVRMNEDIEGRDLEVLNQDAWRQERRWKDTQSAKDIMDIPRAVYPTQNDEFGVTPVPDQGNLQVLFDYYAPATDMSAFGDTHSIPARFEQVIISRAVYYVLKLRSDPAFADRSNKEYKEGLERMRVELVNRPTYFRAASTIPTPRVHYRGWY
jgi:hypothetical protein